MAMIEDLDELVKKAVTEVFTTMLNCPVQLEPPGTGIDNGEPKIAGSVSFAGRINGSVYIYSSPRFASQITCRLLGLKEEEIRNQELVNDSLGEIANMVGGQLKSRFSDRGMTCVLSIPSIVSAAGCRAAPPAHTDRRQISFRCRQEDQLVVEIFFKPAPNA
jgi:CheY-specific phosphatase CheX